MPEEDWATKVPPSREILAPPMLLLVPSLLAVKEPACTEMVLALVRLEGPLRSSTSNAPGPVLLMRVIAPLSTPVRTRLELLTVMVPLAAVLLKVAGPLPLTFRVEPEPIVRVPNLALTASTTTLELLAAATFTAVVL